MKRKLGFKYTTGAIILGKIDRLAEKEGEVSPGITKQFAQKWCKKQPEETELYHHGRVRHMAMFSAYLCDLGISSYIPKLPPYPRTTFYPYIYSQKEIDALFKACDELVLNKRAMKSCLFSMPTLLRLLYSTGLRISEALALTNQDVNLEENYLRVKDCKNGKQRIIPISNSLVSVCKEYVRYRDRLPIRKTKWGNFFVRLDGKKCGLGVRDWFKICLEKAAIQCTEKKRWPRIHDLRHTFAVTSLANMAEAGIDLYASLPILSTYLGHQSLGATNHYVRLTANMFPDLVKDVDMICLDVFPKPRSYETD
ncbi:tyrosine-type recombinase/integrase [Paraflavisolibacter sp. H34]|uniref:tyrosine-type recombinase/integrase n=1 Tax=Huijunlia imazamoxiresistens TaxID=3127457 RepID=UPI003018FBF1